MLPHRPHSWQRPLLNAHAGEIRYSDLVRGQAARFETGYDLPERAADALGRDAGGGSMLQLAVAQTLVAVVDHDPRRQSNHAGIELKDLTAVRRVVFVMRGGVVYKWPGAGQP